MKSTPCSIPNKISWASFLVIPGSFTDTPGTLTPFLFFKRPAFSTTVWINPFSRSFASTRSSINPSSNKMRSFWSTSSIKLSYVTEKQFSFPMTSVIEMSITCPCLRCSSPFSIVCVRISGPFVSNKIPTVLFSFRATSRIVAILTACSS